ncbi:MAG: glycosyltransferase [Clostridia bacterium]|nr:glycosyltransferase [Clostridia bacterium]
MITLSVCLIVKNEEKVLAECLSCVKPFADEIIIVDTGSVDKTIEVAKNFTNKIFKFEWIDDFSAARNFSFSKAICDYIMWLDADDIILQEDISAIQKLKKDLNPIFDMVAMKYVSGIDVNGKETFYYYRERIVKKSANFKWQGFVHETIPLSPKLLRTEIRIIHNKKYEEMQSKRNLLIYENALKKNIEFTNRDYYYYARELYYHGKYKKAIKYLKFFIKNEQFNMSDIFEAHLIISQCYHFLKNFDMALKFLIDTFKKFIPNAKLLCKIGDVFFEKQDYLKAIFWYETAINNANKNEAVFIEKDFGNIIPFLQLCVCYYQIDNIEKAIYYNNKAKEVEPNNKSVQFNNKFFTKIISKNNFHLQDN